MGNEPEGKIPKEHQLFLSLAFNYLYGRLPVPKISLKELGAISGISQTMITGLKKCNPTIFPSAYKIGDLAKCSAFCLSGYDEMLEIGRRLKFNMSMCNQSKPVSEIDILLDKARKILESGTHWEASLKSNIESFYTGLMADAGREEDRPPKKKLG